MLLAASIEVPVEGMWLVQEATDKCLPAAVAGALVEPVSTAIPLCLLNPQTEPVTEYASMTLATLEDAEVHAGAVDAVSGRNETATVDAAKQEILWGLVERAGPDLSPGEKDMFFNLLLSYADVLASSTADLGMMDRLWHKIHTGEVPPIRRSVHRVPPQRREEVRELLNDMLERRVVEPLGSTDSPGTERRTGLLGFALITVN